MNEKLLTFNELKEYLNISTNTLKRLITEGLPYLPVGDKKRFQLNKVVSHLEGKKK